MMSYDLPSKYFLQVQIDTYNQWQVLYIIIGPYIEK